MIGTPNSPESITAGGFRDTLFMFITNNNNNNIVFRENVLRCNTALARKSYLCAHARHAGRDMNMKHSITVLLIEYLVVFFNKRHALTYESPSRKSHMTRRRHQHVTRKYDHRDAIGKTSRRRPTSSSSAVSWPIPCSC